MKTFMSIVILAVSLTASQAWAWDCPAPFSTIADKAKRCKDAKQSKKDGALTSVQANACCGDKPQRAQRSTPRTPRVTGNYVKVDDFSAFTGEEGNFGKLQTEVERLATFHPGGSDMVTHEQISGLMWKLFFLLLGMVIVAGVMGFIAWKLHKMIKDNAAADEARDNELTKLAAAVLSKTDVEPTDLA